jgi:hypothetical protein
VELYRELFPDRPCPSFQSLHRFAKGIGEEELWGLVERLKVRLQPLLPQEEALLLMDSTGLAHFRKGQRLRCRRGSQLWQVRGHSRLLCLVRYYRRGRLLALEGVAVGPACASHVRLGLLALAGARAQGQLPTDAGFDAISLRQLAAQKGLVAHIPLKGGPREERRLSGRRHVHPSLYRLRGVVAGVSGAIKTRLAGGYLQEMLPSMAQKRGYLEATAYNLRLLLRLLMGLLRPWPLSPPPGRCSY